MNNDNDWFEERGLRPPTNISHGISIDDIKDKLKPLKATSWRLEGNKLIAQTEMGEFVNYISTDYILKGMDEDGLPILVKVW